MTDHFDLLKEILDDDFEDIINTYQLCYPKHLSEAQQYIIDQNFDSLEKLLYVMQTVSAQVGDEQSLKILQPAFKKLGDKNHMLANLTSDLEKSFQKFISDQAK